MERHTQSTCSHKETHNKSTLPHEPLKLYTIGNTFTLIATKCFQEYKLVALSIFLGGDDLYVGTVLHHSYFTDYK